MRISEVVVFYLQHDDYIIILNVILLCNTLLYEYVGTTSEYGVGRRSKRRRTKLGGVPTGIMGANNNI